MTEHTTTTKNYDSESENCLLTFFKKKQVLPKMFSKKVKANITPLVSKMQGHDLQTIQILTL